MKTLEASTYFGSSDRTWEVATRLLTLLLALLFIVAGVEKLVNSADFETSLIRMELFPDWTLEPVVAVVPLVEIALGLMCLIVSPPRIALQGLLVLTVLYTLVLTYEWIRGIEVGCACFGPHSGHWPHWALLVRNLGLVLVEGCLLQSAWFRSGKAED